MSIRAAAALLVLGAVGNAVQGADPWADRVVSFTPGVGGAAGFDNPSTALGSPTRITGDAIGFPGPVTPFAAAFESDELVSIGRGGSLTVAFDEPIFDSPDNPYGIDLLIFGNSFYFDVSPSFTGLAGPLSAEGGLVEVSADGVTWFALQGAADGAYPTLAYTDLAGPYDSNPGNSPTDFTRPVNPAFDATGLTFAEIVAGYQGSGGGAGFDIASTGLSSISFVRVSNPLNATGTPEIDGFAAVPAPGALAAVLCGLLSRRRRTRA